ncbi:hypothetical protein [Vibrio rotiferianus]|uniref:hypothetical protein n=1 Tax=Vibrio rotiferianus TaxID=190895 RepID=UPI003F50ED3C
MASWLTHSEQKKTVSAKVISNTLTQSLDGQRRYLTVQLKHSGSRRIQVPTSTHCPEGASASFEVTSTVFSAKYFNFLSCQIE